MSRARVGVYEALTRLATTQAMSDFDPEPSVASGSCGVICKAPSALAERRVRNLKAPARLIVARGPKLVSPAARHKTRCDPRAANSPLTVMLQ
jgi:hypothetical protein